MVNETSKVFPWHSRLCIEYFFHLQSTSKQLATLIGTGLENTPVLNIVNLLYLWDPNS